LAQPSGIVHDQKELYVVDSEGSAVRKITTDPKNDLDAPSGTVTTIAGTHDLPRGRSLFEFGDVDGTGDDARFQHPLGLTIDNGSLYVADSYNHKIRRVDLKTREVSTWAGTGNSGSELATLELSEPAGLAISNGKMYVADTNNHRIVVIDMATKKASELTIKGLTAPNPANETGSEAADKTPRTDVERQELNSGDAIQFEVQLNLPEGYKLNELFPNAFRFKAEGDQSLLTPEQQDQKYLAKLDGDTVKLTLPIAKKTGEATLEIALTFGYCRDQKGGVCKVGTTKWKVPVVLKDGAKETTVRLKAKGK
jgi:sugar lactone lactonase YvrE